jgi:hypothetical protein
MIIKQESNSEEVPKVSLSCQASVGSPFVHLLFTSFSGSSSMLATTNHHCAILKEPVKPCRVTTRPLVRHPSRHLHCLLEQLKWR